MLRIEGAREGGSDCRKKGFDGIGKLKVKILCFGELILDTLRGKKRNKGTKNENGSEMKIEESRGIDKTQY